MSFVVGIPPSHLRKSEFMDKSFTMSWIILKLAYFAHILEMYRFQTKAKLFFPKLYLTNLAFKKIT